MVKDLLQDSRKSKKKELSSDRQTPDWYQVNTGTQLRWFYTRSAEVVFPVEVYINIGSWAPQHAALGFSFSLILFPRWHHVEDVAPVMRLRGTIVQ